MEIDTGLVGAGLLAAGFALGHYVTVVKLGHRAAARINAVIYEAARLNSAIANGAYVLLSEAKMTEAEYAYRLSAMLAEAGMPVILVSQSEKSDVDTTGSGG
jgi:hypothetical protein